MTSGARRSVLGARTEELLNERPNSDRALRVSDLDTMIAELVLKVVQQAGYVVGGGGGGGGSLSDGDYGDVTVSGGGVTMTVDAGAISLSKMANLAASTILGRAFGAGTGAPQALSSAQLRRVAEGSNILFHASTGATLTLTAASEDDVVITGSTSLTVVLPDVSTLTIGRTFRIRNAMGIGFQANVQSSGLNSINAVVNGMDGIYTVIALTGTDDTPWLYRIDGGRSRTGSGNLVFSSAPTIANPVFTGVPVFPASVVGGASARIPHGVAPTAPVDGDIWTETSGIYVRINGVTVGPLAAAGAGGGASPALGWVI